MKVGLVIPFYNRVEYFHQTLRSLSGTRSPYLLYLVNDASTQTAANELFASFRPESQNVVKHLNRVNHGMAPSLLSGWRYLSEAGCDVLANLDSDAIVKPEWLDVLLDLHLRFEDRIVSGFHTENHPIRETANEYYLKNSIGGINLLFSRAILPLIEGCMIDNGWDWSLCELMKRLNRPFVVSRPSVVQHIGQAGTNSSPDQYDLAKDFEQRNCRLRMGRGSKG